VRADLGHMAESDLADRWKNPTSSQPLRWKKRLIRIVPGFSSLKLVVPPLQPGAVGPYLVWGTRFTNRLLQEGTGSCPDLLGRNRWSVVPEVQDPDNILLQAEISEIETTPPAQLLLISSHAANRTSSAATFSVVILIGRKKGNLLP
jgi:hypothetical protein